MITSSRLVFMMMFGMTILGSAGPIAAFATAYGGNADSLADKIMEDVNRILDGVMTELPPTIPPSLLRLPSPPAVDDADCMGRPATIVGTDGNDNLIGTEGEDVISGLGGDDKIIGLGGVDFICADEGDDSLYGDDGSDWMSGGADDDVMDGGADDDTMGGVQGNDGMAGGNGRDYLNGGTGDDIMDGGADEDSIVGDDGSDSMNGDDGNDVLYGIDQVVDNDNLDGSAGTDICRSDPDPEINCEA
jgi:Ca2+-binding RTX toxin-like protein